jgi:hypothetical protein
MPCPHSRIGEPARCSQCLGAVVRHVSQRGADLLIDGEPTGRTLDDEDSRRGFPRRARR